MISVNKRPAAARRIRAKKKQHDVLVFLLSSIYLRYFFTSLPKIVMWMAMMEGERNV
jgi:hypothetical protein